MSQTPSHGDRSFLAWVWASALVIAGLAYLAFNTGLIAYSGPLLPVVSGGVALLSLPFLGWWLTDRQRWWALISAWVFFSLALLLVVIFLEPAYGQLVLIAALGEVAVPFLVAYLVNREQWWRLIVAYAILVLAGLLAMTIFNVLPEMLGAFALLAVALPFWLAYMLNRQNRWALIPAGILSITGVVLLIFYSSFIQSGSNRILFTILNGTLAAVFLAVWLTQRRLDWSLWVAIGFAVAAILSIWFPPDTTWALLALTLGSYIAYRQIRAVQQRQAAASPQSTQPPVQTIPQPPPPTQPQQAATPPTPSTAKPPPGPTVSPGLAADREATTATHARGASEGIEETPVVGFRPLNPFEIKNSDEEE